MAIVNGSVPLMHQILCVLLSFQMLFLCLTQLCLLCVLCALTCINLLKPTGHVMHQQFNI